MPSPPSPSDTGDLLTLPPLDRTDASMPHRSLSARRDASSGAGPEVGAATSPCGHSVAVVVAALLLPPRGSCAMPTGAVADLRPGPEPSAAIAPVATPLPPRPLPRPLPPRPLPPRNQPPRRPTPSTTRRRPPPTGAAVVLARVDAPRHRAVVVWSVKVARAMPSTPRSAGPPTPLVARVRVRCPVRRGALVRTWSEPEEVGDDVVRLRVRDVRTAYTPSPGRRPRGPHEGSGRGW